MLDVILTALALFTWCIFVFRYWRVGSALDRYEGMILRPLSISVDLLAVHYLFNRSWWPALVAFWWGFFSISGVAGGTIRPERSSKELANPPRPAAAVELETLSHEDSMQISKAIMKLSFYGLVPEFLLFHHHGMRWYYAVAASMVASVVIGPVLAVAGFSTAVLAFRKSAPSARKM